MYQLTLPPHFRKQLETRLEQLQANELQLWELPPEIAAWYTAGWAEAMQIVKRERREYEHRLDIAYIQMMHPKEKAAEIRRRMIEHFQREDERFFAEPPQLPDISSTQEAA